MHREFVGGTEKIPTQIYEDPGRASTSVAREIANLISEKA